MVFDGSFYAPIFAPRRIMFLITNYTMQAILQEVAKWLCDGQRHIAAFIRQLVS